jgi:hypothetical protein
MEATGLSLAELESEHAEYLPAREVMWCCRNNSGGNNFASVNNGSGDGNTYQDGLVNVSLANGNLNGIGNVTGIFQQ